MKKLLNKKILGIELELYGLYALVGLAFGLAI